MPQPTLPGAIAELALALQVEPALVALDEAAAERSRAPGKWSRKEILGHLADSAGNNLQRFVRGQIPAHLVDGTLRLRGYVQDDWVRVQGHSDRPWLELVRLWACLNAHILWVLRRMDRGKLGIACVIGGGTPLTLEALAVDYVGHVKHHLAQLELPSRPG